MMQLTINMIIIDFLKSVEILLLVTSSNFSSHELKTSNDGSIEIVKRHGKFILLVYNNIKRLVNDILHIY